MKQTDIVNWLTYWQNSNMVAIAEINAFDQVHQARKFCSCMRVGVFSKDLVTDLQIWRALQVMRSNVANAVEAGSAANPAQRSEVGT